jgi:hypothetical protein
MRRLRALIFDEIMLDAEPHGFFQDRAHVENALTQCHTVFV